MSSSDPAKSKLKEFALFRLPAWQTGASFIPMASRDFVLQTFDADSSGQAGFSEAILSQRADQVLAEAEAKRQYIEEQAYEEGFRQGQKDGQEVGRRGLEEIVQRFETMVAALAEEKERLFHHRERELVELALTVSRKIVSRELRVQPEAIREVLAAAFDVLRESERLRLRVHPQDYEFLKSCAQAPWPPNLEMLADSSLTPGGFSLETDQGEIDGTLETRWARIDAAISRVLGVHYED